MRTLANLCEAVLINCIATLHDIIGYILTAKCAEAGRVHVLEELVAAPQYTTLQKFVCFLATHNPLKKIHRREDIYILHTPDVPEGQVR